MSSTTTQIIIRIVVIVDALTDEQKAYIQWGEGKGFNIPKHKWAIFHKSDSAGFVSDYKSYLIIERRGINESQ